MKKLADILAEEKKVNADKTLDVIHKSLKEGNGSIIHRLDELYQNLAWKKPVPGMPKEYINLIGQLCDELDDVVHNILYYKMHKK